MVKCKACAGWSQANRTLGRAVSYRTIIKKGEAVGTSPVQVSRFVAILWRLQMSIAPYPPLLRNISLIRSGFHQPKIARVEAKELEFPLDTMDIILV